MFNLPIPPFRFMHKVRFYLITSLELRCTWLCAHVQHLEREERESALS
ncbi:MAG: hypothetical protein ACTS80_00290 [Candidatus Hodgkinia cicadicola]